MLLKKVYDEKTLTEKAWYDSSMFYFTRMVEDPNENKGELYVTFKNGATYHYFGVRFEDYVLLIAGGTDASQGKTLNKVIKGKYDFERVADESIALLEEEYKGAVEKNDELDRESTYFISGHRDLTEEEFDSRYKPAIISALAQNPEANFIMGDYHGCDIMAQNYLLDDLQLNAERVVVFHMGEEPKNKNPKVLRLKGGFNSDEERDSAMTETSFEDIAFVRDWKELSGTAQNILRRFRLF